MQSINSNQVTKLTASLSEISRQFSEEEDINRSADSESSLVISLTPEKCSTTSIRKSKKRKRKRPISSSEDDFEEEEAHIDHALEEKLQECAKRNDLSALEIKKILKSVVANDHVLAIVKLQEEEELAHERAKKRASMASNSSKGSDGEACIPKLTRAKARALNQKPIPIPPLNEKEPEPEVAALICQELISDEEDEEYCPKEEDYVSDDDPATTISDIDSQPRTPLTPLQQHHDTSAETPPSPRFTDDGLFKLPRERNDSGTSHHEEIIAKRTRSKLCLQTTPIEAIESTFVPPDITTDMYDFDGELDQEWVEFLNEFTKPLNATNPVEEDEDEADPEYVAADKVPLDAEELRDVNISKKELSDLIAELFDGLVQDGVVGEEILNAEAPKRAASNGERSPEKSPQRKRQKANANTEGTSLSSQKVAISQQQFMNSLECSDVNENYFNPNVVSTPQQNPPNGRQHQDSTFLSQTNEASLTSSVPLLQQQPAVYATTTQPFSSTNLISWPSTSNPNQMMYISLPIANICENGPNRTFIAIPIENSNYRLIETAELTKATTQNDRAGGTAAKPTSAHPEPDLPQSTATVQKMKYYRQNKKKKQQLRLHRDVRELYAEKYEKLKYIQIHDEIQFDENQIGFTQDQRAIFDQHLRMHVQFCVQNFIQTYSHPELWKLAQPEKDMLLELERRCGQNENTAFNAWNLKPALDLIKFWEDELSVCSEENRALMDYFYSEIDRIKNRRGNKIDVMRFPPRIMKLIIENPAFMYPELLPTIPFRFIVNNLHQEFCPSEDYVIAHAMDYYFKEIKAQKDETNTRRSDLRIVCEKITKNLITWRSWKAIYSYIVFCRDKKVSYNPIKFYFERGRVPPFKHVLHPIDLDNVQPPKARAAELPSVWKEFVTNLDAAESKEDHHRFYSSNDRPSPSSQNNLIPNEITISSENIISQTIPLFPSSSTNPFSITANSRPQQQQNQITASVTAATAASKNVVINFNYIIDSSLTNNPEQLSKILNNINPTNLFNNSITKTNYINFTQLQQQDGQNKDGESCVGQDKSVNCDVSDFVNTENTDDVIQVNQLETINSSLLPQNDAFEKSASESLSSVPQPSHLPRGQKLLTDFFKRAEPKNRDSIENQTVDDDTYCLSTSESSLDDTILKKKLYRIGKIYSAIYIRKNQFTKRRRNLFALRRFKLKAFLQRKFKILANTYKRHIDGIHNKFNDKNLQRVYIYFKALELYTNLLKKLRMYCKKVAATTATVNTVSTNPISVMSSIEDMNCSSPVGGGGKRPRLTEDELKMKKSTRANENLKQMLVTESNEDINKKDAIYASNFYERVEEAFKEKNNMENFNKFQNILKKFDPKKDRVADLYNKIENLFLPDHPDLVQIFLTFLLPSQASEIGKFFEYFMLTNMTNFVNKLNIYFNKQPSQIKKVYTSLNELSDERDLTMDKIKSKILPLLKGNQFLTDWFLQMFPEEEPPKSLGSICENINAKQLETQTTDFSPEFISQKDLMPDSPDHQPCQIRYINGRIFYGSRILLPAKLAFVAKNLTKDEEWQGGIGAGGGGGGGGGGAEEITHVNSDDSDDDGHHDASANDVISNDFCDDDDDDDIGVDERLVDRESSSRCVHYIRAYAEKIIRNSSQGDKDSCTEGEKSEDEDGKEIESKYKICDDVMHRKHAIRLNPSLYSSPSYPTQTKIKCEVPEREINKSPKKQCMRPSPCIVTTPVTTPAAVTLPIEPGGVLGGGSGGGALSPAAAVSKDKRKSPTKKTPTKSPGPGKKTISSQSASTSTSTSTETSTNGVGTTGVTVAATTNVIKTAKKLKAIIEEDSGENLLDEQSKKKKTVRPKSPTAVTTQKLPATVAVVVLNASSDAPLLADSDSSHQSHVSVASSSSAIDVKPPQLMNWTRDEDKIILEEVKLGFNCEETLANRLKVKLPNRTIDEIIQRHQFLMDVLSQLQSRT